MSQTNTANPPPNGNPSTTPQETAQPTAQQTQPQVIYIERRSSELDWFDREKGSLLQVAKYIQIGLMIIVTISVILGVIILSSYSIIIRTNDPDLNEFQEKILQVFRVVWYVILAYVLIGAMIGIIAAVMENYILQLIHTIMFILSFPYCLLAIFVAIGFKQRWSTPDPQSQSNV